MTRFLDRVKKVVASVPVPALGFPVYNETFGFFNLIFTDDVAFKVSMQKLASVSYGQANGPA